MHSIKNLANREADRAKSRNDRVEQSRLARTKSMASKASSPNEPVQVKIVEPPPIAASSPSEIAHLRPWARVIAGESKLKYTGRANTESMQLQPWAKGLVNALLAAADEGHVHICLVWPAKLGSAAMLHAISNMERNFALDMRGLRTVLFPGTHATGAALQGALANREQLSNLYRSLWVKKENGMTEQVCSTHSASFVAALEALTDIQNWNPDVPNPALAELAPVFMFDDPKKDWTTTVTSPLERTLSKAGRLANRQNLRVKVNMEWSNAAKAPGALMVLHHTTRKESWKLALSSPALRGQGRPEVFMFDASAGANSTSFNAVKRIPDLIRLARETGYDKTGMVVITDDPKTFFVLETQMREMKLAPRTSVWAAEGAEALLAVKPEADDWRPAQKSNSNFSVGIVDRDASQVALLFQRLAVAAGNEDSPAHQALLAACLYLLRLSNMPAGYTDLTQDSAEAGEMSFTGQRNAWTPVKLGIEGALNSGALNARRAEVATAIKKAETLIDDWSQGTPMAIRLLAEVRKYAIEGMQGLAIVLPNSKYIVLAHHFLQRKLGAAWASVEPKLEWHILSSVGKTLMPKGSSKHFLFVGMNPDVLRILVTHAHVPHGTAVLIAYRQAESTLVTLERMKGLDAFKPYRGRIGLLVIELDRRMKDVPNPLVINKLNEMSMTFNLDEREPQGTAGEQPFYKFDLEGGGHSYVSGWVYRYEPDEDPFFRRAGAGAIRSGDFVFEMSDELRAKVEGSLRLDTKGAGSTVDPVRMFLKLYHSDVQMRCKLLFSGGNRRALARQIHARMVELDPKATACTQGRVYYWLDLQADGDTRPHAARDSGYFKLFCRALDIDDERADQNWNLIRNARRLNQNLGRELVARYAEILFQPESASAYRKIPDEVIKQLQQEALRCVYKVENVTPPKAKTKA
jgi:hypothetical protein